MRQILLLANNVDIPFIITALVIIGVIVTITIYFTRWVFKIDDINHHLKAQTLLLAKIAEKQGVHPSIIQDIIEVKQLEMESVIEQPKEEEWHGL